MGTLFLVSTPIGNLGDVSRRAAETLGSVSRVLAEDTRRSRILLGHLGLDTPLLSLHEHNEASRTNTILAWLAEGEDLAMVSDAGTPLLSDPGGRVVFAAVEAGHTVVPIPGPSAVVTALVASGLPTQPFAFLGFPPRKGKDREAVLRRVADSEETTVLFESPERLEALLEDLEGRCGADRRAAVARELTKIHEEFVRGTLAELVVHFQEHPPRGEITLVVAPTASGASDPEVELDRARALARELLLGGMPASRVARELADTLGIPRNRAYELVLRWREEEELPPPPGAPPE